MHRILFKVFGLTIYSYGVMLIVAFFVGVWMARRRAGKYGVEPDKVWDVAFWMLIGGVLGARILFILQDLPYFLQHRDQLWTLRFEGLTSFGGVIGGLIALLIWCLVVKVGALKLLEVFAPCFLVGSAIGRVGCLLNGCCYGGRCTLPWAITVFDPNGHMLPGRYHPAQIYDSLMNLAALAVVLWWERRKPALGQVMALTLVLHGVARFIYEFWRAGTTSDYYDGLHLTDAQLAAGFVSLVGITLFAWFAVRRGRLQAGRSPASTPSKV